MSPFAGYTDFAECVRQNQQADDPDAYCGHIKHQTEDKMQKHYLDDSHSHPHGKDDYFGSTAEKMQKAIDSASYLHQMVRAAIITVAERHDPNRERVFPTKECPDGQHNHEKGMRCHAEGQEHKPFQKAHDPVKEAGKKKLTAKDGVANEGAQDDQAFAVAFGPDNYDKLTKAIIAAPYQEAYNAAGTILKALENKQFNFPGNIEEHMKKAHAAIHGREMWDARYSDVCDLITQARKILHSIEKTAEVSQGGSGMMVVGKADPGQDEQPKQASKPPPMPKPYGPKWQREQRGVSERARKLPTVGGRTQYGAARKAVQKAIKAVRGR